MRRVYNSYIDSSLIFFASLRRPFMLPKIELYFSFLITSSKLILERKQLVAVGRHNSRFTVNNAMRLN